MAKPDAFVKVVSAGNLTHRNMNPPFRLLLTHTAFLAQRLHSLLGCSDLFICCLGIFDLGLFALVVWNCQILFLSNILWDHESSELLIDFFLTSWRPSSRSGSSGHPDSSSTECGNFSSKHWSPKTVIWTTPTSHFWQSTLAPADMPDPLQWLTLMHQDHLQIDIRRCRLDSGSLHTRIW